MSNDDATARLIRGLAMAEGFSLHVVISESTRSTDAFLEEAKSTLEISRGASPLVRRLNPYATWQGVHDAIVRELTLDDLRTTIAAPLLMPCAGDDRPRIDVLDASGEISTGTLPWLPDDAWGSFFDELNEARNTIVAAAPRALVVALPARLEPVFAERAADFWSLRSADAVLTDQRRPQPAPGREPFLEACEGAIRAQTYFERDDLRAIVEQNAPDLLDQVVRALSTQRVQPLPEWEAEALRMTFALIDGWSLPALDWAMWDERGEHLTQMPKGSDPPDGLAPSALWLLEAMSRLADHHGEYERAARWGETAAMDHWGMWAGGGVTGASPQILRSIANAVRLNLAAGRMAVVRRALAWGRQLLEASPWERYWLERDDPSYLVWPPHALVRELGRLSDEAGDGFRAKAYEEYAEMLARGRGVRFRGHG